MCVLLFLQDRVFDYLDNLPRLDPEDISVVGSFLSGVVDSDQLDAVNTTPRDIYTLAYSI